MIHFTAGDILTMVMAMVTADITAVHTGEDTIMATTTVMVTTIMATTIEATTIMVVVPPPATVALEPPAME